MVDPDKLIERGIYEEIGKARERSWNYALEWKKERRRRWCLGSMRLNSGFLWLPKFLYRNVIPSYKYQNNDVAGFKWLCHAYWIEMCCSDARGHCQWLNVEWTDKEKYINGDGQRCFDRLKKVAHLDVY